jgi:hypothetical protein
MCPALFRQLPAGLLVFSGEWQPVPYRSGYDDTIQTNNYSSLLLSFLVILVRQPVRTHGIALYFNY